VLVACFALNMFGRGVGDTYAVFLLPLEREFGWSRSELTGVYSIYLLVNGFTAPLVGLAFDRLGPRWVFGAGVACLGAGLYFAGGLSSLWQFYLFIGALVGIGVSLNGMVPGSALLARWYRARLSTAIGIAFSAVGVGTLVFVPLAQYLVSEHGWRLAYRSFGAGLLLLTPLVLFALPWRSFAAGHPDHRISRVKGESGWTLRAAMGTPVYRGLAQVFFCTAAAMFSVVVQLVAFFIDAGFSPLTAATAYGALGMILLLFLEATPSAFLLMLFVPVFGLCMGVRGPIVSSVCAQSFPGARVATIYGTIYATNALGAAFGSWMGGLLHDLTGGYRLGLAAALVFIACAAAPFWTVPGLRNFR